MRPIIHYLICLLVIGLYGGQVCPFLESLPIYQLLMPVVVALGLAYVIRRPLRAYLSTGLSISIRLTVFSGWSSCSFLRLAFF